MLLGEALSAASARNAALVAAYKYGARNLLSRSVSSLALSMADQRKDLGRNLASFADIPGVRDTFAELDLDPERLAPLAPWTPSDICEFLTRVRESESVDYEILACLAGAFVGLSSEAAERLALLSEASRRRASWAQDHLDLLGICPG